MTTEPIPLKKGRRRKTRKTKIVNGFKTFEARISWFILSAINVIFFVPFKKLFPTPSPKCAWCGHAESKDLTTVNGDDYNQPPITVCTNIATCTERYWAKDF